MRSLKTHKVLIVISVLLFSVAVLGLAGADDNSLIIGRPSDAISLDSNKDTTAAGGWVYGNITEPLIKLNADMELEPCLAESWKFIDETTLRFNLREGVEFHDGTQFDAEAVKFTFDRALFEEPLANWQPLGADPIEKVEVVDDYTVDIITEKPYGPLEYTMAMVYTGIISPTAVEEYGDEYGHNPVGTGPFKFERWRSRSNIVLTANKEYWKGEPRLDRVEFRVMPEEGSRSTALRAGEIDMILKPAPHMLSEFSQASDFELVEERGLRVFYMGLNTDRPPLDDIRVRHALAYAVDSDEIVDTVTEDAATTAHMSLLAPGVFGFYGKEKSEQYPYDPDKALELLKEAGWKRNGGDMLKKDGETLTLKFLPARDRYLKDTDIAQVIESQLRELGIKVEFEMYEWATAFDKVRSEEFPYDVHTFGWVTTNVDADYTLHSMFISDLTPPKGWNAFRYSNSEVDRLIKKARSSIDSSEREKMYARAQSIIASEVPFIPIYTTKEIAVVDEDLEGLQMHPVEYNLNLYPVHW